MARKPRNARVNANRRNARRSTGPRTPSGKKRVAQNALRHGLAVPVTRIPEFEASIDRLAGVLAGPDTDPERIELARRVAEAQIDLGRVRLVKLILFGAIDRDRERLFDQMFKAAKPIRNIIRLGPGNSLEEFKQAQALLDRVRAGNVMGHNRPIDPSEELVRLDRYERRARSRRQAAIHAFDSAQVDS